MNKIEETKWAKEFLEECPTSYKEAIKIASRPNLRVCINRTNESGEKLWAITPDDPNDENYYDFWLDSKKTRKEAIRLCKEMGWKIVNE